MTSKNLFEKLFAASVEENVSPLSKDVEQAVHLTGDGTVNSPAELEEYVYADDDVAYYLDSTEIDADIRAELYGDYMLVGDEGVQLDEEFYCDYGNPVG